MTGQAEADPPADPGVLAVALGRDDAIWAREHLAEDIVAWLTTVNPDGTPQSSVISFLWDGDTIFAGIPGQVPRTARALGDG